MLVPVHWTQSLSQRDGQLAAVALTIGAALVAGGVAVPLALLIAPRTSTLIGGLVAVNTKTDPAVGDTGVPRLAPFGRVTDASKASIDRL